MKRIEIDWTSYNRRRAWQAAPIQGMRDQRRRVVRGWLVDVTLAVGLSVVLTAGVFGLSDMLAKMLAR